MTSAAWWALAILLVTLAAVVRGAEVRLALGLAALAMGIVLGRLVDTLAIAARELTNPATVVPIGASMGFAFVVRETGCDQHLVRLLLRPLRAIRALLIPGGVLAGYIVNSTIVSQAGTAAVLGPILLPLLQASGIEPALAGATLLLGASMGGELFNPGAVEIRTLAELTGDSSLEIIRAVAPRNLLASAVALGAFWFLAERKRRATPTEPSAPVSGTSSAPDDEHEPIHVLKALVPLLPLALLFLEPFAASALGRPRVLAVDERAFPRLSEPVTILAAMLAGVAAAALVERRVAGRLASAFFEGAGYAYTHVISLIAVAMVFASGIEASGLMSAAARSARQLPWLLEPATWITACFFAWVCGSGIAPAVAVMRIVVPEAEPLDLDPKDLGGMAATGGHFGRTMSPAAAVVAMASRLSQVEPRPILQYVAGPLLLGGSVLILATVFGWV